MDAGRTRPARATMVALSIAATGCSHAAAPAPRAPATGEEQEGVTLGSRADVAAARELDHEGIRSFREGRYVDAIRYFRASFRLGGPSSELWNIARCREKLDAPERAATAIEEYLARVDLSPEDRADAEREGRALRARPSTLTVTTNPPGAAVTVDGKPLSGTTPLSIEVPPGPHTLTLRCSGCATETRPIDAHFGHAVLVSLDLGRASK